MRKILSVLLVFAMVFGMSVTCLAAIATSHSDEARDVLSYVNEERRAAGLSPLKWESSLVGFANVRANEIRSNWSHTRPNGESPLDYPGCDGENLAYGSDYTAADVVHGWMNSPGHRANILQPAYTSMAVACIEEVKEVRGYGEVSIYYWVQLFHIGQSGQSGETTENSTGTSSSSSSSSAATTASVNQAKILEEAQKSVAAAANGMPTVTVVNGSNITKETIGKLSAVSTQLTVYADTTWANSSKIQSRDYLRPAEIKLSGDTLALGVWTESGKVAGTKAFFEKWFSNKIAVVQIDQPGSLGARTHIAAQVDLEGFHTNTLVFYIFDKTSNQYNKLENPGYSVDQNGFVHFYTDRGGSVVITDQGLVGK